MKATRPKAKKPKPKSPPAAQPTEGKPLRVPDHDFLKLSECAGALRCSERSILRLIQSGDLDGFRPRGGASPWRITRESFLRFIHERIGESTNS